MKIKQEIDMILDEMYRKWKESNMRIKDNIFKKNIYANKQTDKGKSCCDEF